LNYECIRYAIAEYRPNELYCSQWLGMFIEDAFKNTSNVLANVENTLKELLDNNKEILENRISDDIIEKFIDYLAKDPQAKYVELLKILILSNNNPIVMNQKRITNIIFTNEHLMRSILVFLDHTPYKIMITFGSEVEYQRVSIENFS
jgi:RIH domain